MARRKSDREKDKPATCCVYAITGPSGLYIGQTREREKRWVWHRSCLRRNRGHSSPHLQNAWNKYGENAFTFSIMVEFPQSVSDVVLTSAEQAAFDKHQGSLYNAAKVAGVSTFTGRKHSAHTLAKMRNAKLGKPREPHVHAALRAANLGRKQSPEHAARSRQGCTGLKHSAETRAAISARFKGVPKTDEHVRKWREAVSTTVDAFGDSRTMRDWCIQFGVTLNAVHGRLRRGFTIEQALSTPLRQTKRTRPAEAIKAGSVR